MAMPVVLKLFPQQKATTVRRLICTVSKIKSLPKCDIRNPWVVQMRCSHACNAIGQQLTVNVSFGGLSKKVFSGTSTFHPFICLNKVKPVQTSFVRCINSSQRKQAEEARKQLKMKTAVMYSLAVGVGMLGLTYLGVPLYRMFCQQMGLGGASTLGHKELIEGMSPVEDRVISVNFSASTDPKLRWIFKPKQNSLKVVPGETALAFYTAKNTTDRPIIGIATYNVTPPEAALYFNKIQCFCFEEQRLNPKEEVDMPVFFYLDPEYDEDPALELADSITLSYTFFESKAGMKLPLPGYPVKNN